MLGRYDILKLLGSGGVGEVFYAYDHFQKKHVAIKKIKQELSGLINRDLLQYEFHIISKLKDPYLISVYDFFMLPYNIDSFFTMEYIAGDIYDRLIPLISFNEHMLIALKVSRALHTLHQQGILHLDIKSSNIMIRQDSGEPVLMDFGLSREKSNTAMFFMQGTLNYMAPEIAERSNIDIYSDIYSLGILFYKIFTKRFPYIVKAHSDISKYSANKLYKQPMDINCRIPVMLNNLIMEMIEYEPDKRVQSTEYVVKTLLALTNLQSSDILKKNASVYLFYSRSIGREAELQAVKARIRKAAESKLNIIGITGPQGIGKSHFLNDIKLFLQSRGFYVVNTNCLKPLEGSYYIIIDVLLKIRTLVDYLISPLGNKRPSEKSIPEPMDDDSTIIVNSILETHEIAGNKSRYGSDINPAKLRELSSRIENVIKEYRQPGTIKSSLNILKSSSVKELFYRTFDIIRDASYVTRIILIIEDLNFDKSIQSFLNYFINYLENTITPDLYIFFSGLSVDFPAITPWPNPKALNLDLKPLSIRETQIYASSMLGYRITGSLAGLIYRKTKGNPAQVQEFLRYLFNRSYILWMESRWHLVKIPGMKHEDISSLIMENLKHLTKKQQQIIALLSLSGIPLIINVLEKCTEGGDRLERELELLEKLRIVESRYLITGHKTYSLSFNDYSTHVLDIIPYHAVEGLTALLSRTMVDYYFKSGLYPEIISVLCYKSRIYGWCYVFSRHIARRLMDTFSYNEALRYLNLALYSLVAEKSQKTRSKYKRLHRLYTLYMSLFHKTSNRVMLFLYLKKSLSLGIRTRSRYKLCDNLLFRFNYYLLTKDYKKAQLSQRKAIPLAQKISLEKYVRVLGNYAITYYYLKDMANYLKAMQFLEKPILDLDDDRMTGIFYINIGIYYRLQYNLEEAYANYIRSLKIAEESGNPYLFSLCYGNISTYYFYKKDFPKAVHFQKLSLAYSKAISDISNTVYSLGLLLIYQFLAMTFYEIEQYFPALESNIRKYSMPLDITRFAESHIIYLLSLFNTMQMKKLFSRVLSPIDEENIQGKRKALYFNNQLIILYYNIFILYKAKQAVPGLNELEEILVCLKKENLAGEFEFMEYKKLFRIIEMFSGYIKNPEIKHESDIIGRIKDLNADIHYSPIFIFSKVFFLTNIIYYCLMHHRDNSPSSSIPKGIDAILAMPGHTSRSFVFFLSSCFDLISVKKSEPDINPLMSFYTDLKTADNTYQIMLANALLKKIIPEYPCILMQYPGLSKDIENLENSVLQQLPGKDRVHFASVFKPGPLFL